MDRCWWRGHNWDKWRQFEVMIKPDNYTVSRQKRVCKRCGKIKWRRIDSVWNWT